MGIETMVSIWPQIDWRSENYEEMKQQGLLVKANSGIDVQMVFHGNNVFLDATNPRTRKYVWEKIRKNYADIGVKAFWLDEAEPEFTTYDFESYRYFAGLHMGLCGIPWWTTDIGGFHGGNIEDPDFRELLVRWFQFGTFCPVMRIHGSRNPHKPVINKAGEEREGTGADNEVWSFGEDNYPILVRYIRLRERMRDYTRSVMREAHEKGHPVMRTLFYEFPQDEKCWNITDEYMFGPDILVAPVVQPKVSSRLVYLPEGASWTDLADGKVYEGGQVCEIQAPIEKIPVFLRDGRQEYLMEAY